MAQKKGSVKEGEMSVLFDLGLCHLARARNTSADVWPRVYQVEGLHPTRDIDLMMGDSSQMQSVCFNSH